MRDTRDPYENRRAKVVINRQTLHHLLALPEAISVVGIYAEPDPAAVYVIVEGDHLDRQPLGQELPVLGGSWKRLQVVVDGKVFTSWGWEPDDEPEGASPDALTRQGA
jgi:hypothetical protein